MSPLISFSVILLSLAASSPSLSSAAATENVLSQGPNTHIDTTNFSYIGCWSNSRTDHTLRYEYKYVGSEVTTGDACTKHCRSKDESYAAHFQDKCFCNHGNGFGHDLRVPRSSSECENICYSDYSNVFCDGDGNEIPFEIEGIRLQKRLEKDGVAKRKRNGFVPFPLRVFPKLAFTQYNATNNTAGNRVGSHVSPTLPSLSSQSTQPGAAAAAAAANQNQDQKICTIKTALIYLRNGKTISTWAGTSYRSHHQQKPTALPTYASPTLYPTVYPTPNPYTSNSIDTIPKYSATSNNPMHTFTFSYTPLTTSSGGTYTALPLYQSTLSTSQQPEIYQTTSIPIYQYTSLSTFPSSSNPFPTSLSSFPSSLPTPTPTQTFSSSFSSSIPATQSEYPYPCVYPECGPPPYPPTTTPPPYYTPSSSMQYSSSSTACNYNEFFYCWDGRDGKEGVAKGKGMGMGIGKGKGKDKEKGKGKGRRLFNEPLDSAVDSDINVGVDVDKAYNDGGNGNENGNEPENNNKEKDKDGGDDLAKFLGWDRYI